MDSRMNPALVQVPANLALAVRSKESADREAAERAEIKRLVLEAGLREDAGGVVVPLKKLIQPRLPEPPGGRGQAPNSR